ncbi:3-phosphoserine/phosphohydroxythreonine transaminase [Ketobacter sp.]|uniref:3-phosphoserine/phosphohydroxythreonine transaminase n=1 Tax=Ketobacter sp. TaxID=2083498 RepID=UPI000F1C2D6B|nr:3-phosphoserine/phosphohydroxythreonine transaminase [Ketobacter sp.]RLT92513.1 MAG: 3-phosphoserine/phosphohydroxythreonine transaminase [Ketobacter sp.]
MTRAFNFCAGPAALPEAVLEKAQAEMLDYQGRGLSVMEMSHRSDEVVAIAEKAEQDLRDLLAVPSDYKVLFLQGGASTQFAMVPMNLSSNNHVADYVNTGQWSSKAIKEAQHFCNVNVVASSEGDNFSSVPAFDSWRLSSNADYLHYCPNETIGGVEFDFIPDVDVPLVADFSSSILSEPLDVGKFDLIYAGAQKNIGPAGLTVVIVREGLLGNAIPATPTMLDYKTHADADSMYNTPPTYAWYLAGLVFEWLKEQGGLKAMGKLNKAKSDKLYQYIDESGFYANPVAVNNRSRMNVPFTLADAALDKAFLKEAEARRLLNLKGHRSVGGMRASIYNAVPMEAVDALIEFMKDFAQRRG